MRFRAADAEQGRARRGGVAQEEMHDILGGEAGARTALEGVIAGGGAQDGVPLRQLGDAFFLAALRQHGGVFDVQHARGLVGALQQAAEFVEIPALVAVERAFGDAGMGLHAVFQLGAEA